MGLFDVAKSYLPAGEDESAQSEQAAELDRQRRENRFGDLPEEIEEMSPEDVADEFARMEQQTRLSFIQNRLISQEKWTEMMTMIKNNPKQRAFWGRDSSQIDIQGETKLCACHKEVTRSWTVSKGTQKTVGQTQGTSETSKTEASGKVSGSGGAGIPGVGNVKTTGGASIKKGRTQGETQQEMAQAADTMSRTQTIHSCRIEPTDSTLSRQAFIQTGNIFIGQSHDKTETESDTAFIDDWEMDADRTAEQEQSQKGIGELREERDALKEQIENLDEQLEMYDSRIEQNETFISQCVETIEESEGDIDVDNLNKRDRLSEKCEEFREKKEETLAKKKQFRTQKSALQSRIENHDDYEEAQEEADTSESASQDADENASESSPAESESAEDTADSAGAHEGAGDGADTDGTPESDDGTPTDGGGDDRGDENESETEEESTRKTASPQLGQSDTQQRTAEAHTESADEAPTLGYDDGNEERQRREAEMDRTKGNTNNKDTGNDPDDSGESL